MVELQDSQNSQKQGIEKKLQKKDTRSCTERISVKNGHLALKFFSRYPDYLKKIFFVDCNKKYSAEKKFDSPEGEVLFTLIE